MTNEVENGNWIFLWDIDCVETTEIYPFLNHGIKYMKVNAF